MRFVRNKYIGLIIILSAVAAAGFVRAQNDPITAHLKAASSDRGSTYKDAVIAHHFHRNHFKRQRSNLDGWLPVHLDTMQLFVTGEYAVASVQDQHFPDPVTPALRGPPAA